MQKSIKKKKKKSANARREAQPQILLHVDVHYLYTPCNKQVLRRRRALGGPIRQAGHQVHFVGA